MARRRRQPHWIERAAAGVLPINPIAGAALTPAEREILLALRAQIAALRAARWVRRYLPPLLPIAQRRKRMISPEPMPGQPDHLGWRCWRWDVVEHVLRSPNQSTAWPTPELRVERWRDGSALRGVAGIHARRLPLSWRHAAWPAGEPRGDVTGVVERFGRYVLGTEGWRAEWVVIRELMAPDVATMLAIMRAYPEVRIHLSPHAPCVAGLDQESTHEDR